MAQTFARSEVGVREDLADFIANVDMKDTPYLSMIPKGPVLDNPLYEWQVDKYDIPNMNGVIDGTDVSQTQDMAQNRARLGGRIEHLWQTPKVSNIVALTNVAGIGTGQEFAKGMVKAIVQLKRSVESVLCSDQDSQADTGSVPYNCRGIGKWIQSTAQTDLPVPTAYLTPTASIDATAMASLTPSIFNGVMQSQYDETGQERVRPFLLGSILKKTVSNMAGYQPTVGSQTGVLRTESGSETTYVRNVMSFEGDFGKYEFHLSNWLNVNSTTGVNDKYRGYALDIDMHELRFFKPWDKRELPDLGGGRRGLVECIFGQLIKNPRGGAKFAATS